MDYRPKKTDCGALLADGGRCDRERRPGQQTCKRCHAEHERTRRGRRKAEAGALQAELQRLTWENATLRREKVVLGKRIERLEDDLAMAHARQTRWLA